jgi:hypothetical protein
MDKTLRNKLIRLAYDQPKLRSHLLPLLASQKQADGRWFPRKKGDPIYVWERMEAIQFLRNKPVKLQPGFEGTFLKKHEPPRGPEPSSAMMDQLGPGAWDDWEEPKYLVEFPRVGKVWVTHDDFMRGRVKRILFGKELQSYRLSKIRKMMEEYDHARGVPSIWRNDKQLLEMLRQQAPKLYDMVTRTAKRKHAAVSLAPLIYELEALKSTKTATGVRSRVKAIRRSLRRIVASYPKNRTAARVLQEAEALERQHQATLG